ncbi:50S ribosomal protein L31 [Candidatus Falkowbacteria bacterium]|nr:50S ribosomal protein L31 [Candidatus Falkowbacteria bacterium]
MKKDIHPEYYKEAKVTCACGNSFTVGSTVKEIETELCFMCHPFYTGTQKLVDTARRVDKFKQKLEKASAAAFASRGKKVKRAKRAATKQAKAKAKKTVSAEE